MLFAPKWPGLTLNFNSLAFPFPSIVTQNKKFDKDTGLVSDIEGDYSPSDTVWDKGHYIRSKASSTKTDEVIDTSGFVWSEDEAAHSIENLTEGIYSSRNIGTSCIAVSALGEQINGADHRDTCDDASHSVENPRAQGETRGHSFKTCCAFATVDSVTGKTREGGTNWRIKSNGRFILEFNSPATAGSRSGSMEFRATTPTHRNIKLSLTMSDKKTVKSVTTDSFGYGLEVSRVRGSSKNLSIGGEDGIGGKAGSIGGSFEGSTTATAKLEAGESAMKETTHNQAVTDTLLWTFSDQRSLFTTCHSKRTLEVMQGGECVTNITIKGPKDGAGLARVNFRSGMILTVIAFENQSWRYCYLGDSYRPHVEFGTDKHINDFVFEKNLSPKSK